MAQKTNLNVSPYFDDFDLQKNFYKVLFNPGRPIQTRELNTIQSILQNQVESFGKHIFKDGSVVIPGNLTYDPEFYAVKLNAKNFGVNVSLYLNQYVGKRISGQVSGIVAEIQKVDIPDDSNQLEYATIFVKYVSGSSDFTISQFQDGESIICEENVVYGNTTITAGTPFASLISSDATSIGSAASIDNGIYFVRGTFVSVVKQTIILDQYSNLPSYKVGLNVSEEIITAKDDSSLYDNAKGFNNYAAPGADRLKISLTLVKKSLDSVDNDSNFIELLRVENGIIKKLNIKTDYSLIRDYLAQRTYDESGNYAVIPFKVSLHNSLNDGIGSDGLFFDTQKTEQGDDPSDNLMCVKLSPGKAFVKGYDIEKTTTSIIDVQKPRQTQSVNNVNVPFEMGNLIVVNNVDGSPKQNKSIELHSERRSSSGNPSSTTKVGDARVYNYQLTDSAYEDQTTNWDLYLYDIQTYTKLTLNVSISSLGINTSFQIKGKSSGASGYSIDQGTGSVITLRQTSGTFIQNEQILINGIENKSGIISSIVVYDTNDIKQLYQPTSVSGFTTAFLADSVLTKNTPPGFTQFDAQISIDGSGNVTSPGKFFDRIKIGSIIRYQKQGSTTESYNKVVSINETGSSMSVSSIPSVSGVCDGSVGVTTGVTFFIGSPQIKSSEKGFLYAELPNSNISSVDLNDSILTFTAQSTTEKTVTSGQITLSVSDFSLPSGLSTALFSPFDEERYSVHYNDGTTENLTPDKFSLSNNLVTLSKLPSGKVTSSVNATFIKNGVQSKLKQYNRSQTINVIYSKYPESGTTANQSINDGLSYNNYYGLRVQDEKISLNYPDVVKVLAIYESLDSSNPTLDTLNFDVLSNVGDNAIVGENIFGTNSNAAARVVSKTSTSIGIVYLNSNKFIIGENISFLESSIKPALKSITLGKYNNITNRFTIDKGQKEQYYDYSSIIRNRGESEPSKRLLIVFDYYTVPQNDNGDVFTVLSYDGERFSQDIPSLGAKEIRASDTLDFRPRVAPFTVTTSSPFDFSSRDFSSSIKLNLAPDESSIVSYSYYLGRVDKLFLDKVGSFVYNAGVSADNPSSQEETGDLMELASISLPPYLYNISDAVITLVDNKRYTMRDIGKIEARVKNLETVTSLSLLELKTETFQIQDAQGLNRYKTGFFVDDFNDNNRVNLDLSLCEVNPSTKELTPIISRNSLKNYLIPKENLTNEVIDLSANYELLDSNVQKTGDSITLKYDSVEWISQLLATRVENINPFHVSVVRGIVTLSPSSDSWVRTIELPDRTVSITNYLVVKDKEVIRKRKNKTILRTKESQKDKTIKTVKKRITSSYVETESSSTRSLISSRPEEYMRSRNTEFVISNLKSFVEYYQFIDGNASVDFVPKLLEISPDNTLSTSGSSGIFEVGETVIGYDPVTNDEIISFRVAVSNHKLGPYNNPSYRYSLNPYKKTETIPDEYSQSSSTLNVDTFSLSNEAQGLYSGYVVEGTVLVGQNSNAIAYVSKRRLITDANGSIIGTFFLRDPNTDPAPLVRINTGTKTFKVSSSSTNKEPVVGDTSISSAETTYTSEGTLELYENAITNPTTIETRRIRKKITRTRVNYHDPLAQSFIVGNDEDDANGVFITSVDIYFYTKSSANSPVTVEIRTMELGTPTLIRIGDSVTLNPDQINVSDDGTVPTKFTFNYPIYLEPNAEYALVLLSPESTEYQVFIAQMNEVTVETKNLPGPVQQTYNQQWGNGSLFKSQNGSIWTADQNQDLKFKLYRADFTTTSATAYFSNPSLDRSNGYVKNLINNPITTLPKKLNIGITTTTNAGLISILTSGRKVGESVKDYIYGYIVGTGCSVSSVGITTGGINYATGSNVQTYNIVGSGSGLTLNIANVSAGTSAISSVSVVNSGRGYAVGDVVGIVTSTVSSTSGSDARITILGNNNGIDTLYLSNVQGQEFTDDGSATLVYYDNSGTRVSLAGTAITSSVDVGSFYTGNYAKVEHFNHGMYGLNNKVSISGILPNDAPTTLNADLTSSSTTISVANTSIFSTFEGVAVGSANTGYVLVGNELISYEGVNPGTGESGTLTVIGRGKDLTKQIDHYTGEIVYKYELNGVSLRKINTTHDISDSGIDLDSYYIEFDRDDRSSDASSRPQLSFNSEVSTGGNKVYASENILFDSLVPYYNSIIPKPSTFLTSRIRTVTGTSVNGNETSFLDQGYEDIQLNSLNKLSSVRSICSKVNEEEYLDSMPRNKSSITAITLSTTNNYLSPQIFLDDSFTDYRVSRINLPVSNYAKDGRVNSLIDDPHIAYYISNTISLSNPSTSLKVIVSAYRHADSDFRVLYSLIRPDSSEVEQSFELFPGYDNLSIDNNNDGFLDVVNPENNSGLPDIYVSPSLDEEFKDYEFSVNNIGPFTGYAIKIVMSSSNQAQAPRFKDLRTIALA
jgi:hypothetical protein